MMLYSNFGLFLGTHATFEHLYSFNAYLNECQVPLYVSRMVVEVQRIYNNFIET